MADTFTPTEAQIEAVLAKYTPRQIAIAYLRASHRAKQERTAFNLMSEIADFTRSALVGDLEGAESAVKAAERHLRTHAQNTEASNG
jgi:hypothetical protein